MGRKSRKKKRRNLSTVEPQEKRAGYSRYIYLGWLVLIIFLTVFIRSRLLEIPLERDEGEYAYAGQLILQHIPPYGEVYNMKLPGMYFTFAIIEAFFGQSVSGIHIGLLIVNIFTIITIFFLARRLFNSIVGMSAAAVYAVLSVGQYVRGVFAHAEHFVVLFTLLGILLLVKAIDDRQRRFLFLSGLAFGIALLMKQQGAAFIGFAISYLLFKDIRNPSYSLKDLIFNIFLLTLGVILPFGLTCLFFFLLGMFEKFWFWTFTYAQEYVSLISFREGLLRFNRKFVPILGSSPLLWLLSATGFFALLWDTEIKKKGSFIGLFLFFSLLSIMPGFWFREHYFILVLPVMSLLAGVGIFTFGNLIGKIAQSLKTGAIVCILVLVLLHSIYLQRAFLFEASPNNASRKVYGMHHPFPESVEIAKFVSANTLPHDRVLVLGSEPQILFYAKRRSATGYIYMYPMTESQPFASSMKEQMIREIELNRPEIIVYFNMDASWVATPIENEKNLHEIIEWMTSYIKSEYNLIGIANVLSESNTQYSWHRDFKGALIPTIEDWIGIYKRKTT